MPTYTIIFKGKPSTKAKEFKGNRNPRSGRRRRHNPYVGQASQVRPVFYDSRTSGPSAMRARLGGSRRPIRTFAGPNLAKEAAKPDGLVAKTFLEQSRLVVPPIIEKYLARLV
jgi:hypothetical protein